MSTNVELLRLRVSLWIVMHCVLHCAHQRGYKTVKEDAYRVHNNYGVFGNQFAAIVEVLSARMRGTKPERIVNALDFLQTALEEQGRWNL